MATSDHSAGRASGPGAITVTPVVLWAGLLAGAAISWAITVRAWIDMGNGPGTMGRGLAGFVAFWVTMMAAMMLPSVAPFGTIYLRTIEARSQGAERLARTAALVAGYLGVWAAFGVAAYLAAWGAGELAVAHPGVARWVAAAILLVAGGYQLTPLKERCLRHCRSPIGFLLHVGNYRGPLRDLRTGAYHGSYCVGCCWSLMAVLIAVGVMNLAWMAGLAAVILLEKVWRYGARLGQAFGIALIVLAFFVPWNEGLAPGLFVDPDQPAMDGMRMDGDPAPATDPAMEGGGTMEPAAPAMDDGGTMEPGAPAMDDGSTMEPGAPAMDDGGTMEPMPEP
jgi:predicted metal-binding membrane protein